MSRLDDELRIAFERKQAPPDLAARVLERINRAPAPERNWRERLAALFAPPKLRWVAIGVAASLLVAVGVAQYNRLHDARPEQAAGLARTRPGLAPDASGNKDEGVAAPLTAAALGDGGGHVRRRDAAAPRRDVYKCDTARTPALNRPSLAAAPEARPVSAEAEAAKERVLFALQILDSTLADAQRVIQEDTRKAKSEPLHNR
ncbi:MAG: hypothetical protein ACLGJB_04845 [Blastocatellia bacterium]